MPRAVWMAQGLEPGEISSLPQMGRNVDAMGFGGQGGGSVCMTGLG